MYDVWLNVPPTGPLLTSVTVSTLVGGALDRLAWAAAAGRKHGSWPGPGYRTGAD